MYLEPHGEQSIGVIVDVDKSKGGLELPTGTVKNVSVFFKIVRVGPDAKRAKVDDVVLAQQVGHCYLRDGTHFALIDDKQILATVKDLDLATVTIEGERKPVAA